MDTTPPDTTIDMTPPNPSSSASADFTFHSSESGSTFDCKLDTGSFAPCPDTGSSYSSLADGPHTFDVRATDAAGNTDASAATFTWTIDTTPPAAPIITGPHKTTHRRPTFKWNFDADVDHY